MGSVRFSRLDLKTAIPLNPDDYPDDFFEKGSQPPSPSPRFSMDPHPDGSMETSQSIQSLHSLRSISGSNSNMSAQDIGHLEGLRQASGSSNAGQADVAHVPARLTNRQSSGSALPVLDSSSFERTAHTGSGHMGLGHMGSGQSGSGHMGLSHMGSGHMVPSHLSRAGSSAASGELIWPNQQSPAGLQQQSVGLSTVPETQQSSLPAQAPGTAFMRSRSLQPQNVIASKPRGSSNLGNGSGRAAPAERVKWSDKPTLSTHF